MGLPAPLPPQWWEAGSQPLRCRSVASISMLSEDLGTHGSERRETMHPPSWVLLSLGQASGFMLLRHTLKLSKAGIHLEPLRVSTSNRERSCVLGRVPGYLRRLVGVRLSSCKHLSQVTSTPLRGDAASEKHQTLDKPRRAGAGRGGDGWRGLGRTELPPGFSLPPQGP